MKNPSLELNEEEYRTLLSCVEYSTHRAELCRDQLGFDALGGLLTGEYDNDHLSRLDKQIADMSLICKKNSAVADKLKRFLHEVEELENE